MRKIYLLLILISIFALSCGNHFFNPRYYYNKSSSSSSGSNPEPPAPPEELPEGVDEDMMEINLTAGYSKLASEAINFLYIILKSLMVRIGYQVNQIGKEIWLIIIFLIKEKIKFMMLL